MVKTEAEGWTENYWNTFTQNSYLEECFWITLSYTQLDSSQDVLLQCTGTVITRLTTVLMWSGLPFIHLWNLCFWRRAVLGWRGSFVPWQQPASREVQRATGPQCVFMCVCLNVCVCVYACVLCLATITTVRRPPLLPHMPARVSLLPRSHEQAPQSSWPAAIPPHMVTWS